MSDEKATPTKRSRPAATPPHKTVTLFRGRRKTERILAAKFLLSKEPNCCIYVISEKDGTPRASHVLEGETWERTQSPDTWRCALSIEDDLVSLDVGRCAAAFRVPTVATERLHARGDTVSVSWFHLDVLCALVKREPAVAGTSLEHLFRTFGTLPPLVTFKLKIRGDPLNDEPGTTSVFFRYGRRVLALMRQRRKRLFAQVF